MTADDKAGGRNGYEKENVSYFGYTALCMRRIERRVRCFLNKWIEQKK